MNSFCDTFARVDEYLVHSLSENSQLGKQEQLQLEKYYSSYKRKFPPYVRGHYASQVDEVEALLKSRLGLRILEVGCGCGTEAIWFAAHGASVVGIDLSEKRLGVARHRAKLIREDFGTKLDLVFVLASLFDLDYEEEFDVIWMEQAFHHIEPRHRVAPFISRLLKPGGRLILSESNAWNPLVQMSYFFQRGFKTTKTFTDANGRQHPYGVERITTPFSLSKVFSQKVFTTESVRYFRTLPNVAFVDRLSFIDRVVPQFLVPAFTHYNMVLRKK